MFPFIIIIFLFYLLIILPQQKKERGHKKMIEGLKKGDRVVTIGGICGKVDDVRENSIIIEIAPKVKVECLKTGILSKS
ncbi:TPA: preprotein translocase subunit YajC [bacterium]|nr:preprotein translocase subunit YajC [bacterium]